MNIQPIEKREIRADGVLSVHSIFRTIQGEGPFTGYPAIFVRLWGCNLQCPGCDTEYSSKRTEFGPKELLQQIRDQNVFAPMPKLVVITGGEPFRQNISPFVGELLNFGLMVQVETNGTLPPPPGFPIAGVTTVVSPKAGSVHPVIAELANAYKYVMSHKSVHPADGLPKIVLGLGVHESKVVARPTRKGVRVYLQPEDSGDPTENALNLKACIDSCMMHNHILQLQVHKLIGME